MSRTHTIWVPLICGQLLLICAPVPRPVEGPRYSCLRHCEDKPQKLPKDIITKKAEGLAKERGSFVFRQRGPLLALVWQDKRQVQLLSTMHYTDAAVASRVIRAENKWQRNEISCPVAVAEYTKHMGGLDMSNQLCNYYLMQRRGHRWNIKALFYILKLANVNAYQLFCMTQTRLGKKPMSLPQFTLSCVEGLTIKMEIQTREVCLSPLALQQMHTRVLYMRFSKGSIDKQRQTMYGCLTCKKHLFLSDCFSDCHQLQNYY